MNIVIVNCFDTFEERLELIYNYFRKKGDNVSVIGSNFKHIKKIKRDDKRENYIYIDVKPYSRNLSVKRMYSHYKFSKDAIDIVEKLKPDLLYVMIPANSLGKFVSRYKKKNSNVKVYFDIIDLWPESLPIRGIEKLPLYKYWQGLRDRNLNIADVIITECDLYQVKLEKQLMNLNTKTIHLAKKDEYVDIKPQLDKNIINLCYLGSINNIIDIKGIVNLIYKLNKVKPTKLHIIGEGESKNTLIEKVLKIGAKIEDHGNIYDANRKQEIFNKCMFGLNMMKDNVCVGLTMKSIDYFMGGLPIINNIKYDTTHIVEMYNIGFNINEDNIDDIVKKITDMNNKSILNMRKNTKKVFDEKFSVDALELELDKIFN